MGSPLPGAAPHWAPSGAAAHAGSEADGFSSVEELEIGERSGRDEQDVLRIEHEEVGLVLDPGDVDRLEDLSPHQELEQRLLGSLATDVARAGAGALPLAPPGDLVDLVDEYDSALRELNVLIGAVQKLAHHDLDVLAVVAGLGVLGRVGDGEGHLETLGQRARDVRLAGAGRTEQQQVRLLDETLAGRRRLLATLEVVVGRDGDRAFGALLADDIAIEIGEDLPRGQKRVPFGGARAGFHDQGRQYPIARTASPAE